MFKLFTKDFWEVVARLILRNKIGILLAIILATFFFSSQWKHMRFTYTEANLLPDDHEVNVIYNDFLEVFGEEGNLIVLGVKDSSLFSVEKLNAWNQLSKDFRTFGNRGESYRASCNTCQGIFCALYFQGRGECKNTCR